METILAALIAILTAVLPAGTVSPSPVAPMAQCANEDGSGAQTFPCYWDGGSNGIGAHYVLTGPANG